MREACAEVTREFEIRASKWPGGFPPVVGQVLGDHPAQLKAASDGDLTGLTGASRIKEGPSWVASKTQRPRTLTFAAPSRLP